MCNHLLASLVRALPPSLLLNKLLVLSREYIGTLVWIGVFVLQNLAFDTGELVALRASDKLALVAAFVGGNERAALPNAAVDGVIGLKFLSNFV